MKAAVKREASDLANFPVFSVNPFRAFLLISLASTTLTEAQITDPISPDPSPSGLGITLKPWVRLPDSDGRPARMSVLRQEPEGGRIFVNDQRGALYVIEGGRVELYLDLAAEGLLFNPEAHPQMGFSSFALHPEFQENGLFYTVCTRPHSGAADFLSKRPIINSQGQIVEPSHDDVIFEWRASDPKAARFSGTRREILRVEQPYRDHNVGEIAFHPTSGDGLLYVGSSDGGSDGLPVTRTDPLDNGQDLSVALGKILRIDPSKRNAANGHYGIPQDNPFVNEANALPEIYAYGQRNPHRFNWDRKNPSAMYTYDIGQSFVEEINKIIPGGNYGWGDREGIWEVRAENESALYPLPTDDASRGYIYPVAMYDHESSPGAIAGGFVYRGNRLPDLSGHFIFADFTWDGSFFHAPANVNEGELANVSVLGIYSADGNSTTANRLIGGGDGQRTDVRFGEDSDGELFVLNKQDGWIYQVFPSPSASPSLDARVPGAQLVDEGSRYFENPWFSNYFELSSPWIYHEEHGAIAVSPANNITNGIYFWDGELEWVYAEESSYPWVYLFENRNWAYFEPNGNTRWFYRAGEKEWVEVPKN